MQSLGVAIISAAFEPQVKVTNAPVLSPVIVVIDAVPPLHCDDPLSVA
jgi:hypothetical protein